MKIAGNTSIGAICRAMGVAQLEKALISHVNVTVAFKHGDELGVATFRRKGGDRLLVDNIEIDDRDARDLLESDGTCFDEEEEDWHPQIEDRDLEGFITACTNGDRHSALALASRIFTGANLFTAERLILGRMVA